MPGMVDAISAASIRLRKVAAALSDLVSTGAEARLKASDEEAARMVVRVAIRELERAIEALATALAEESSEQPERST